MQNYQRHSGFTKKLIAIAVVVIIIAAGIFYVEKSPSTASKASADVPMFTTEADKILVAAASPLRQRLVIAAVSTAAALHSLDMPGIVEADPAATVNILPPLTGRLSELKVKLGDAVKAGQVLAVMSSADLAQAYADVDKARDALDLAQRAQHRGEGVNSAGANAAKDLEQINSTYNQALAEFNRAEARLKTLGANGKSRLLTITAPISGSITALNNGVGAYINDSTATMMTVTNLDHVWVTANVPEDLVAKTHIGQHAEVSLQAYPGVQWQGKIASVSAIVEPDSHRNKARINFNNTDGRLKPNMYANVKLAIAQDGKLMIPTSALLMNNDSITVFVETAPWTFVRRTVAIGSEDGEQVSVLSGLNAGERVVVRGGVLMND